MGIIENINKILEKLPKGVKLVAVSKTKPKEDILEAYEGGYRIFGENKPQELVSKYTDLPKDIEWHMIGHLQTNKVKYIAPFVSLIHAVDSVKLLNIINKEAEKNDRVIDCLLQFHIASEETKFGLSFEEGIQLLSSEEFKQMKFVRIVGVMGMATNTDNKKLVAEEFAFLRTIFNKLKIAYFSDKAYFAELSMGMSGDYEIAVQQGSTIVRVGSSIFGYRNYL